MYVLGVIIISIICENVFSNTPQILNKIHTIFISVRKLIAPFVYGFFIAYLFNPIVSFIENKYVSHIGGLKSKANTKRILSIMITYIIVIGCSVWLIAVFVPSITSSVSNFISLLPSNASALEETIKTVFDKISFINSEDVLKGVETVLSPLLNLTADIPLILQTVLNGTVVAASTLINVILAMFISFYMIYGKEGFLKDIQKIILTFFNEKTATYFIKNCSRVNDVFKNFIIGKSIDSLIIGVLCFLGLSLIKAPFATVISVIVGLTNMIPYFGPFIGAVPAIFIVLLSDPTKAIWVGLFIFALQQFDGNYLGPKILGNSTGMSPLWIIFSITVGGGIAGPIGMFLGVPICASAKMFFTEYVDRRYAKKFFYDVNSSGADEKIEETDELKK